MRRFFVCLILSVLISFGAVAKTIDQKKEELKKIYEAGGISKVEYEKSIEFLENPTKEKKSNIILSVSAVSAVAVFGIILTL